MSEKRIYLDGVEDRWTGSDFVSFQKITILAEHREEAREIAEHVAEEFGEEIKQQERDS